MRKLYIALVHQASTRSGACKVHIGLGNNRIPERSRACAQRREQIHSQQPTALQTRKTFKTFLKNHILAYDFIIRVHGRFTRHQQRHTVAPATLRAASGLGVRGKSQFIHEHTAVQLTHGVCNRTPLALSRRLFMGLIYPRHIVWKQTLTHSTERDSASIVLALAL